MVSHHHPPDERGRSLQLWAILVTAPWWGGRGDQPSSAAAKRSGGPAGAPKAENPPGQCWCASSVP